MLAVKLREEIVEARSEPGLVKRLHPALNWHEFIPPRSRDKPARLGEPEGDAEWFFHHTYPSTVIKEIIEGIRSKLAEEGVGIIPARGDLGSQKTHSLMTTIHIFNNTDHAQDWLQDNNIYFSPPGDALVIPIPLLETPVENLWEPFFASLGFQPDVAEGSWPRYADIKEAVDGKPTIVLIDEIDTWFGAKPQEHRSRTRGFIQSLAETSAEDDVPLIVIVMSQGENKEVLNLLRRAARDQGGAMLETERTKDTFAIVRFRLYPEVKPEAYDIVDRYIDHYQGSGLKLGGGIKEDMNDAYPIHPVLLKYLGSLRTRDLLTVLAKVVKRKYRERDLIISQDLDDDIIRSHLTQIDDRLVDAYSDDLNFIRGTNEIKEGIVDYGLARGMLLTALLASLADKEINFQEIALATVSKEENLADLELTIDFLTKWTRLKRVDTKRYTLTTEMPPAIKIERRAELIDHPEARQELEEILRKRVDARIRNYKVYLDPEELQDKKRMEVVALLEEPEEKEKLYDDLSYENAVIFLYPSQSLLSPTTMKLIRRVKAAEELKTDEEEAEVYSEFYKDYKAELKKNIRTAGWHALLWSREKPEEKPIQTSRPLKDFGQLGSLISTYSSRDLIEYFCGQVVDEEGIRIKKLKDRFYRLRGAPLLLDENKLYKVISHMVKEGALLFEGRQGIKKYKERVSPTEITDESRLSRPPEETTPPTVEELYRTVKTREQVSFRAIRREYPLIDEKDLWKISLGVAKEKDDIYVLEDGKVVTKSEKSRRMSLITADKAAEKIQRTLLQIVRDRKAAKLPTVIEEINRYHSGADEELVWKTATNLEIYRKISLDKSNNILKLPRGKLVRAVKRELYGIVKEEEPISEEEGIKKAKASLPVSDETVKDALAELLDEGKIVIEEDLLKLPEKTSVDGPRKRRLWKEKGAGESLYEKLLEDIPEGELFDSVRLSSHDLDRESLAEILLKLDGRDVSVNARRKPS